MANTVKTGWLHDKNGDKFAPKTLASQVQTNDGTLIEDKILAEIETAKADILENGVTIRTDTELSSTSENPVQNKVIKAEFDAVSAEMDGLEAALASHTHDELYDEKGSADEALASANTYTDTKTSGLASTAAVNTSISNHNTATSTHEDIRLLISDLSTAVNNFLDVDDTTKDQLSEVLALIDANKGTLESLTTSKVNVADIVNNLTTNVSSKVLSAAQGVAIKGLIDALQAELDGKAPSSHTHTVSNISDLTATATELNYTDGVTSNIQTQLDSKLNISSVTGINYVGDLNNAPTGICWVSCSRCTNTPVSDTYGYLETWGGFQKFTVYNTGETYYRGYINSAWAAWKQIDTLTDVSNLKTSVNEKLPLSGGTMKGSITMPRGTAIVNSNNMPILEYRGSDSDGSGTRVGDYNDRMVFLTSGDNLWHYNRTAGGDGLILDTLNYTNYAAPVSHNHDYLPLSGGTLAGNLSLTEGKNILLRPTSSDYTAGIGHDTKGHECVALWAKNSVTRLRWHAGIDMTSMASGTMMNITPDFEVDKSSGSVVGRLGGNTIIHSGNIGSQSVNYASSAGSTTLLKPTDNTGTVSASVSSWAANSSAGKIVWREAFKESSYGTDSGDIVLWVNQNTAANGTELNMTMDGNFYAEQDKLVLHSGNYSNYALPKSGGTMTGALTAQNNTNYTTKQVRNVILVAEGSSIPAGSNGDICLVYKP